ncbi:hypothetical protein BsWGS_09708 [Bradybaena similaris]
MALSNPAVSRSKSHDTTAAWACSGKERHILFRVTAGLSWSCPVFLMKTSNVLHFITHRKRVDRIRMTDALVLIMFLLRVSAGLRTGEYPLYDAMCMSSRQMVSVMWDCNGYVQCMPLGNGTFRAVWIKCSTGRLFDPSKMECVQNYKCATPKEAAINICPAMPFLKFPHPSSCALYYDCSQPNPRHGLAPWENECSDPYLFDEDTFTCVSKQSANGPVCGNRPEPSGKCDYKLGCRGKNCTGLEDGPHFDPRFPFSEHFYICDNGTVSEKRSCQEDGRIFDPIARDCTDTVLEDSVKTFCTRNPAAIFADWTRCSLLYDCSRPNWHMKLKPYQTECVYPRLFDPNTASCASFHDVNCDTRPEPIQPCDYVVGHCSDTDCIPCVASCLGLRDGPNAYPGQVLTGFYLVCQKQRTIDERVCAAGSVFDPQMRSCLTEISAQTLDVYCSNNPNGRLLHPSECSVFYSCAPQNNTQTHPNLPHRAIECKYPYLVDSGTITCKPHTLVRCGARREPFSPCDYVSNRCTTKDCTRCEQMMPSCYGKADNFYPAISQEMTADYIVCKNQRVMGSGVCGNGHIFDIRSLTCTDTVYSLSLMEYCTKYRMGRVQNPRNCAQYYDCAISMSEVTECAYPDLYDVILHLCLPYRQVNCAGRPIFLEPCDSFTFCPVQPCPYCNSAYPSCVGRNGAVGGFQFEPSMYYECENSRLMLKYCQTTFNWTQRACNERITPGPQVNAISTTATPSRSTVTYPITPGNVSQLCYQNSHLVLTKSDNCAQFYNCSRPSSALGSFVEECPVGQLFHVTRKQCLSHLEVVCQGRYEPKQVCDYHSMCHNTTSAGCTECRQTYPSCINTTNGIIPLNAGLSYAAVHCRFRRVLNITTCPTGQFYDSLHNECSSVLQNDTVKHACKDRPGQVMAHPLYCAKYFRCSPQELRGEFAGVTFKMEECPYPLLFSQGLCRSYKIAACGSRKQAITPCDYDELRKCYENVSRCKVNSADTCPDNPQHTCIPCEQRYPSCLGAPDGLVNYPGRLFTPDFINCDQGRTLSILKCVGSIFDPDARRCGLKLETVVTEAQRNTASFCRKYPGAVIPHPTHCAQYYNCSSPPDKGVQGQPHLQECRYLRLFDSNARSCENFIKVLKTTGCGNKFQPRHYCDQSSVCPSLQFPTCEQCRKALPSCENQTNGIHGNPPGGGITRGFMYCVEGRVLATSVCSSGTMFHESQKSCRSSSAARPAGRR